MKTINQETQAIIDHYQIGLEDNEAGIIEDIVKMNNGSDRAIIIENLRGWYYAKTPALSTDKLVRATFTNMLDNVDWEAVLDELNRSILPRK